MSDDLRADLAAAIETSAASTNEAKPVAESTPAVVAEIPDLSKGLPEPKEAAVETPEVGAPGEAHPSGDGRTRDAQGRFAKAAEKAEAAPVVPAAAPKAGPDGKTPALDPAAVKAAADAAQAAKNASVLRAPQSLNAGEREHWATTPKAVQEAFIRREQQVNEVLQKTAGARQFTETMTQVVNPFLPMIQSTGANPFEFIHGMLQAASILRSGTAQDKAGFIAHLINQHAVSIDLLDQIVSGQVQPTQQGQQGGVDPALIQQMVAQQVAPFQQMMQQVEQQRNQNFTRLQGETNNEMETFAADPKNEFFNEVRGLMANLIEMELKEGRDMGFQEAYQAACLLHPDVKGVTLSRQKSQIAQQQHAAAQKAKAASGSLTGSPGGGSSIEASDGSLRGDLMAAISQHQH